MFEKIFCSIVQIITLVSLVLAAAFIGMKLTGHIPYIVQSGSMEPLIETGAIAFIDTNDTDVHLNDVITYQLKKDTSVETGDGARATAYAGKPVTHRVIAIVGDQLTTKGDANDSADLVPINKDQVIGTYMFQIPKIGYVLGKGGKKLLYIYAVMIVVLNTASIYISDAMEKEEEAAGGEEGPASK